MRARARWVIAAVAALAAAGICRSYQPARAELAMDNQHYFYIAERAASGRPPHVSQIDSKSQLGPLIAAAAIAVARPLGGDDVIAARTMGMATVLVSVAVAALLAFDLGGGVAGAVLTAGLLFLVRGLFVEGATGVRPQVYVVFFVLLAHFADRHRRPALAGAAAACSFLCWQPTLLVLAALAAAALARPQPFAWLVRLAVGALAPVVVYESYFVWHGAAGAQLFQELVLPTYSVHRGLDLAESFGFVLSDATAIARGGIHTLPAVALAAMALGWAWLALRPRRTLAKLRERPAWLALLLAGNGALVFTLYDHQAHPDLLFVQPYFAVGVGAAAGGLAQRLMRGRSDWVLVAAATAVALLGLRHAVATGHARGPGLGTLEDQRALAAQLDLTRRRYGSVWACGPVHLLGLLHQDNFSPYGFLYDDLLASGLLDGFRPLRGAAMPDLIVLSRNRVPANFGWVRQEYQPVTPPAFRAAHITMLARKGATPAGRTGGRGPQNPAPAGGR